MGAWGDGMRANDTALDALGGYSRELRRFKRQQDQQGLLALLTKIKAEWSRDWTWGVLGIAEQLIDDGQLALLAASRPLIRTAINAEVRKSRLDCWQDPVARKHALVMLRRRLAGLECSEAEVERTNEGLISRAVRKLGGISYDEAYGSDE